MNEVWIDQTGKPLTMINRGFDLYTWYARFTPAVIVLLPAVIAVWLWFPNIAIIERLTAAGLISTILSILLAQIGRDLGVKKEAKLWEQWGGAPTTQILRHRNSAFNAALRSRYHSKLRALLPDIALPTAEEEAQDPHRADDIYGMCVKFLISQTRDQKRFRLVFKENASYGFRRNLWGMKPSGIPIALIALISSVARLWIEWQRTGVIMANTSAGVLIILAFLLLWVTWVVPSWVQILANAYAERLLETCEQLQPPSEEKRVILP